MNDEHVDNDIEIYGKLYSNYKLQVLPLRKFTWRKKERLVINCEANELDDRLHSGWQLDIVGE